MAKNKNRDRGRQSTPAASERGDQKSASTAIDDRTAHAQSRVMPSHDDNPKGRQKRFGHN